MGKYELSQNYSNDWYAYAPHLPFYTVMTVDYNFYLGLIELKQENINAARAKLATIKSFLPEVEPRDEDLALFLHDLLYAEVLLAQDSLEKAIAVFEKTAKLEVDVPLYYFPGIYNIYNKNITARLYKKKGDVDRAILECEKLTDPDSNKRGRLLIHPLWRYELAKLYEEKGEKAKAIQQYEKFLDIWKDVDADRSEKIDAKKCLAKLQAG